MDEKIIYSKYSNDRMPEYCIVTDIIEKSGRNVVRKRACDSASINHIKNMLVVEKDLNEALRDTPFKVNKSVASGEESIDYEFVKGSNYVEILDFYLEKNDMPGFEACIHYFFDAIASIKQQDFVPNDDFVYFFGDTNDLTSEKAVVMGNIDLIFQNVIVDEDENWNLIDYEWTLKCMLPVKFLYYRGLRMYIGSSNKRNTLDLKYYLKLFGIDDKLVKIFDDMEAHFQNVIKGKHNRIGDYYQQFGKMAIHTSNFIYEKEKNLIEVFFDCGEGFSEQDKICFEKFPIHIPVNDKVKTVRIDPIADNCMVKIVKFTDQNDCELAFECDGIELYDDTFLFQNGDPKFIVKNEQKDITSVYIDAVVEVAGENVSKEVNKNKELSDANARLSDANARLSDANAELNNNLQLVINQNNSLNNSIAAMKNSASWKLTSPMRAVAGWGYKLVRKYRWTSICYDGTKYLLKNGIRATISRTKELYGKTETAPKITVTDEELAEQRKAKFKYMPKISILVPVFNTPIEYLNEMIESVKKQTYSNWELCIADGSDKNIEQIQKTCLQYKKKDDRIRYKKLSKNEGISSNTNACIDIATGDYIALFDHDDLLHVSALYECVKVINETKADFIYTDEMTFVDTVDNVINVHYKPDYSPDTLRSYNYICHLSVFSRELLNKVGGFRSEFDGSQDYDMILRLTEQAEEIVHIPKVLYLWRAHKNSVAQDISAKPYTLEAAKFALKEHVNRVGLDGEVVDSRIPSVYKINYKIMGNPRISILIPNKDHIEELRVCIDSIFDKSTYKNIEIIIIENNSEDISTFEYYTQIEKKYSNVKVVHWKGEFNFSAINNFGAKAATGEYILLLNNDVEIITENWIEEMLMFAQRKEVGAVGAMLYYPDDTIQHAGVILGIGGVAGHSHKYFKRNEYGYASRLALAQNLSAVTAACMLMRKEVYDEVGGLDEDFKVAFNDVDLCMRIRKKYLIVFTPYAELYHYESKSRGLEDTIEKQERFRGETERFLKRWKDELEKGDPYYNPNLTLVREDFSTKREN